MKKRIALFLSLLLALSFMACSNQANQNADGARQEDTQNSLSGKENLNASDTLNSVPEDTGVADEVLGQLESIQIKMTFDGKEAVITLLQNPTSQSLLDMLPLDLTFEDYAGSEKISYLPSELSLLDAPSGYDPQIGDVTCYAPWGNLAIFYQDGAYARGLVPIGHVESGIELLAAMKGSFGVTLERVD